MIEVEVDPTLPAETLQQQYYIQQVGVEKTKSRKIGKKQNDISHGRQCGTVGFDGLERGHELQRVLMISGTNEPC